MLGCGRECSRRLIASNLQSTIRDLQRRKARGRRGLALIEGVRLVEEALAAGVAFTGALVAPDLARTARGTALVTELERSEEHTSELQSRLHLVCRLLLEKKKKINNTRMLSVHNEVSKRDSSADD